MGRCTQHTGVEGAMQALKGQEHSLELEVTADGMMLEKSSDDNNNRFVCSMDL